MVGSDYIFISFFYKRDSSRLNSRGEGTASRARCWGNKYADSTGVVSYFSKRQFHGLFCKSAFNSSFFCKRKPYCTFHREEKPIFMTV